MYLHLAGVVGQPNLPDARHVQGIDEPVDSFGNQVGVVHREGPPEPVRPDGVEEVPALLNRVPQVVHLGVVRLPVQVLEEERHAAAFGIVHCPQQAVPGGLHALRDGRAEVHTAVHHDTVGGDAPREIDVAAQVGIHAVAHVGREFSHVHRRSRVHRDGDLALVHDRAHGAQAVVGPVVHPVRPGLGGEVQVVDAVLGGESERVLQRSSPAVIANAINEVHNTSPFRRMRNYFDIDARDKQDRIRAISCASCLSM